MDRNQPLTEDACTIEQIAYLIDEVHTANVFIADAGDSALDWGRAVSPATAARLTRLTKQLRLGADARPQLSRLDTAGVLTNALMARSPQYRSGAVSA